MRPGSPGALLFVGVVGFPYGISLQAHEVGHGGGVPFARELAMHILLIHTGGALGMAPLGEPSSLAPGPSIRPICRPWRNGGCICIPSRMRADSSAAPSVCEIE
jgi:hypothetical protein